MRASILTFLIFPALAGGATLRDVTLDRVEGVYIMRSEVWFDASIEQMFGVFLDWDLSTKFSSVIVESRNVEPDERGRRGYYSRHRACLWFCCRSFERNGFVEHKPLEFIEAKADPARSDFHVSNERWEFRAEDHGTVVIYDLEMKPKFFIPPLIGPIIMKRKLKNNGAQAVDCIEAIAQHWTAERE
ncbi:MAG: SRPBCC family protein [Gammaproteobacteria bacterium]|nr:SRPBCC family protein [Gammaproteobacteria bacterium]